MKKLVLLGMAAFLLGACSNATEEQPIEDNKGSASVQESSTTVESASESQEATEVGEKGSNDNYTYTLNATASPEETLQIAEGIEVTFNSIDVITINEISEEGKIMAEAYGLEPGVNMVLLDYKMSSSLDLPITGIDSPKVVTSTGEQISDNYIASDGAYELQPQATANSIFVTYAIDDVNIESLTLNFEIYSADDENQIYEQIFTDPIEVSFN